MNFSSSLFTTN